MTIIAAFEDRDKYWIASDSIGSAYDCKQDYGSKLIRKNNYIVGFSASYRIADLIRETEVLPKQVKTINDIRDFRDLLQQTVIDSGGSDKPNGDSNILIHPVSILIISEIGIHEIQEDYALLIPKSKYSAVGSGWAYAMGSLYTSKKQKLDGKIAVQVAVRAAMQHEPSCGGNIYTASINKRKIK